LIWKTSEAERGSLKTRKPVFRLHLNASDAVRQPENEYAAYAAKPVSGSLKATPLQKSPNY